MDEEIHVFRIEKTNAQDGRPHAGRSLPYQHAILHETDAKKAPKVSRLIHKFFRGFGVSDGFDIRTALFYERFRTQEIVQTLGLELLSTVF